MKWTLDNAEIASAVKKSATDLFRKGASLLDEMRYDIKAFRQRDPAAKSDAEVALLYGGFHARTAHRLSHKLYENGHTLAARAVSQTACFLTGIEIHPGATIGRGLVIDHGAGVVIGETAEIGDDCTIYQGATLGGTGKDVGKRHPTVEDRVLLSSGAKVLGPVTVGHDSKIGAGSVVVKDVPSFSTVVGVPGRIVKTKDIKVSELDQIHVPDPILDILTDLSERTCHLEVAVGKTQQEKE